MEANLSTAVQQSTILNEIRQLLIRHAEAISSKNADAVNACSLGDATTYSLAPPLIWTPLGRDGLAAWFATWSGPIGLQFQDLTIVAGEDAGFAHSLAHMIGTKLDGEKVDLWFRQTFWPFAR